MLLEEQGEPMLKLEPDVEHDPRPKTEVACAEIEETVEVEVRPHVNEVIDDRDDPQGGQ